MNRFYALVVLLAALASSPGCNHSTGTPSSVSSAPVLSWDAVRARAGQAGRIAASGFVILNHPSIEEATAVKQVATIIATNLRSYQAGGFSTASPAIDTAIDQAFPASLAQYLPLAHSLASIMTLELDTLFDSHPEWQSQGVDIAGIIASFCEGASASLTQYGAKGVPEHQTYVFAGKGYEWTGATTAPREFTPAAAKPETPSYHVDPKCKNGQCPLIRN